MARTVRVALWGGEEEGVYDSTAYVQQHFAQRTTMVKTPEYDKLMCFNDDGGSWRGPATTRLVKRGLWSAICTRQNAAAKVRALVEGRSK